MAHEDDEDDIPEGSDLLGMLPLQLETLTKEQKAQWAIEEMATNHRSQRWCARQLNVAVGTLNTWIKKFGARPIDTNPESLDPAFLAHIDGKKAFNAERRKKLLDLAACRAEEILQASPDGKPMSPRNFKDAAMGLSSLCVAMRAEEQKTGEHNGDEEQRLAESIVDKLTRALGEGEAREDPPQSN